MFEKGIAVVTGGNRGIGFELCRSLGRLGYKVILTARKKGAGEKATKILQNEGLDVEFKLLDVKKYLNVKNLADYLQKKYGRVDLVFNNAGIFTEKTAISTVGVGSLKASLETNTFGPLRVSQVLGGIMKKNGFGKIINVTSAFGYFDTYGYDSAAYRLSKASLNFVTKMLAEEFAPYNVNVSNVSPGWAKTDMGGKDAQLSVEDAALRILQLADIAPALESTIAQAPSIMAA